MAVQSPPIQAVQIHSNYQRAKRVLDIILTLLISPLILLVSAIISICILLDSRGPILYRQKRVGQNGVVFEMLKFRSMYVDKDEAFHREAIQLFINGEVLSNDSDNPYKVK